MTEPVGKDFFDTHGSWRQADIVLDVIQTCGRMIDADGINNLMRLRGWPEKKRRIATLRTVLSVLFRDGKIERIAPGVYKAKPGA